MQTPENARNALKTAQIDRSTGPQPKSNFAPRSMWPDGGPELRWRALSDPVAPTARPSCTGAPCTLVDPIHGDAKRPILVRHHRTMGWAKRDFASLVFDDLTASRVLDGVDDA